MKFGVNIAAGNFAKYITEPLGLQEGEKWHIPLQIGRLAALFLGLGLAAELIELAAAGVCKLVNFCTKTHSPGISKINKIASNDLL